jgi:protein-S-isoprenylcysteine O-methyltransferase
MSPYLPSSQVLNPPVTLGLIGAQTLRSLAMIHASASFAHVVQTKKHDDHILITRGVYA